MKPNSAANLNKKTLEDIGRSTMMSRKIIYAIEDDNSVNTFNSFNVFGYDDVLSSFIEVDKNTYEQFLALNKKDNDNILQIVDDADNLNQRSASGTKSSSIDQGAIRYQLYTYHNTGPVTQYYYTAISEFVWDTMPSNRGTDIFGISRDNSTAYKPGYDSYHYEYWEYYYRCYYYGGGIPLISRSLKSKNVNNDSTNNYSFTMRIDVPKDNIPQYGLANGSWVYAYKYFGLYGIVSFRGTLSNLNVGTHNFNHQASYEHQKAGKLSLSPSIGVNYPLGLRFSISPSYQTQYTNVNVSILDQIIVK